MPTAPDIADCIHQNLVQYFRDLNGETPCGVYDMVLVQVEKPLLAYVLRECGGNQSKAAAQTSNEAVSRLAQEALDDLTHPSAGGSQE